MGAQGLIRVRLGLGLIGAVCPKSTFQYIKQIQFICRRPSTKLKLVVLDFWPYPKPI